MTTSVQKTGVKSASETSCISSIPETMDNDQHSTGVLVLRELDVRCFAYT
jgi:hypothetical protein